MSEKNDLSQETLRTLVELFSAVSFKLSDATDQTGEVSLERHKKLREALTEVLSYSESVYGRNL